MNDEYFSHPIYVSYETSRNGIVRHRLQRIPLGNINNNGSVKIRVYHRQRTKNYLVHRFNAEIFIGDIPHGFVIDHINRDKLDNRVNNFRIVTPSENNLNINPQQSKNRSPRSVTAFYDSVVLEFSSIYLAAQYFDIHIESVKRAAEGIYLTTFSKIFSCRVSFAWS